MEGSQLERWRRWARWIPALIWMAVIFRGSSIPGSQIPGRFSTLGHLGEYAILGALLAWARSREWRLSRVLVFAVALASLYGISDEFHQWFVPGRMTDPVDCAADALGALLGATLVVVGVSRLRRAEEREAG